MHFDVRPALRSDIADIVKGLRRADADELGASNVDAVTALEYGLSESLLCLVATKGGVPFCMFGAGEVGKGKAAVWLLGTDVMELPDVRRFLVRHSRQVLQIIRDEYPHLFNRVDARNTRAIRWLRWLGFEFDNAVTVNGYEFYPFSIGER